jgi:cytochrome c553
MNGYKTVVLAAAMCVSCLGAENTLFKNNCATCHGIHAEKSAIGKSRPIKGLPADQIVADLEAYATGAKPSALPVAKAIKQKFIKAHTKEEIRQVAEYISKL